MSGTPRESRSPSISIIVTFFNQREFVRDALDSILGQAPAPAEVIAVDDGSSDGTGEALIQYGDAVRAIVLERNAGVGAARNAGAAAATGDYLAFLDGDDALLPWAMRSYGAILEAQRPAVVIGLMQWFAGALPQLAPCPGEIEYVVHEDFFRKDRAVGISASAMVVDRRAFEAVGGWVTQLHPMEDHDLLCRLGTAGSVVQIVDPATTFHRAHALQTVRQTEKLLGAISTLVGSERAGVYPGGSRRQLERRACVGGVVFHWTHVVARRGCYRAAVRMLITDWTFVAAAIVVRTRIRLRRGHRPIQTLAF